MESIYVVMLILSIKTCSFTVPRPRTHSPLSAALGALFFLLSVFLQTLLSYRIQDSVSNVGWNSTSVNAVFSGNVLKLVSDVCMFTDPYIYLLTFLQLSR